MNAESNDIRQRLAKELASFDDQLESSAGEVELVASIQEGIGRLVSASGGSEAGIRRVLQEQYESGALRKETFQLVKSVLDRYVTEQIPTAPKPSLDEPQQRPDDVFASTTVIDKADLPAPAPTPDERVQVGSVLRDRFMLQKRIHGGSMGVVYKALDRRLAESGETDHWVAIKILSPQLARNGHALRALQQEASKGRNLAHPNIVRFIDFDRDDDLYFLVMEWLEGRTLAEILDTPGTKKLDIDEALEIVRQVGRALEYAHRCGIVHADVKPGNIMIQRDGSAKLFDFGVARVWQQAEAAGRENRDFDPAVLGAMTPAYSSMQVITGELPTPADDVFSLACLLYRLIAGYRVFGPRNAAEACEEGMKPQPLVGLSKQQWDAVRKALSFSRVARFETMGEFLDALNATSIEKIVAEPRGNVHSEEPADIGKMLVALAAVAIIAAFVAFELGYLDRWLPRSESGSAPVVTEPLPSDAPDQAPATEPVAPAEPEEGIVDLPKEAVEPEPVEFVEPEPSEPLPATVETEEAAPVELSPEVQELPEEPEPEPVVVETAPLAPADFEIPLDRSGEDRAISITLREDQGSVSVDLMRLGSLESSLRVRLEEIDYSGNRSPFRTGQYSVSNNGIVEFPRGIERARFELRMASDPLREADQQSLLKVRALDGDSSGLAHINVSLEDDDQRAFEQRLGPDTVGFAVSQMSVGEQDPAVQVDIVRYNPSNQPLVVEYTVSTITAEEGEDFFSPGGFNVLFAPGQRSARLLIPLVQDSQYEGDEALVVELVSDGLPVPADVYQRIAIMIRDDDPPPGT